MMHELLISISERAVILIDAIALVVILAGSVEAFFAGMAGLLSSITGHKRRDIWLRYGRWLVAGLTFQLAADIIETSTMTDWEAVGRLGAIAVIRTFLNYFLERDMADIRERQSEKAAGRG
jgi:uncharacterized membrane protein